MKPVQGTKGRRGGHNFLGGMQLMILMAAKKLCAQAAAGRGGTKSIDDRYLPVSSRDLRVAIADAISRDINRQNFIQTAKVMAKHGWLDAHERKKQKGKGGWRQPSTDYVITGLGDITLEATLKAIDTLRT